MRSYLVVAIVLLALPASVIGQDSKQVPTVQEVMERVGRYLDDYGARMSVIVGTERYTQREQESKTERHLVSEIALVEVKGDWLGYRDVFEVDGQRISDRSDRLQKLFADSPERAIEQGRRLADESARYNIGPIIRNFNVPTMALFLMQSRNLQRFRFARSTVPQVADGELWAVTFEETRRPTIIKTSAGRDVPVRGTIWLSPSDGRVWKTEMRLHMAATVTSADRPGATYGIQGPTGITVRLEQKPTDIVVTVTYRSDAHLGLLVPDEMVERYSYFRSVANRVDDVATKIDCTARYSEFKRFETAAKLILPK